MTKDEAITHLDYLAKCTPLSSHYTLALQMGIEAIERPEIVRCKDCKHRPVLINNRIYDPNCNGKNYWEHNGDWTCPFLVEDDDNYNRMPNDDDFCSKAEREEKTNDK